MKLSELIAEAYKEDIPKGDVTTESLGLETRWGDARVIAKEDLVVAGTQVFESCIRHIEPEAEIRWQFKDGDLALNKQNVCWIRGDLLKLLKAERTALNFMGKLSGIATLTRCFVQAAGQTECKILDTRKTTPLLRLLEKQAVRAGGGHNHRMGLSDAVLIKENHIRAAGGLAEAVRAIRSNIGLAIETECATLDEVKIAVKERVDRILLDNMSLETMREARSIIPRSIQVEASGNMTLDRVKDVAQIGIDFISVGALTHSAPCADYSMIFEWQKKE